MTLLFLLITLFLLALLKITSEYSRKTGFGLNFGFELERFQDSPKGELIIAKAEWCGHCKRAMPEFNKLLQLGSIPMTSGGSLTVRILDSDKDKQEVAALNVRGFPTIMAKIDEKTFEYNGDRKADDIQDFVKNLSA